MKYTDFFNTFRHVQDCTKQQTIYMPCPTDKVGLKIHPTVAQYSCCRTALTAAILRVMVFLEDVEILLSMMTDSGSSW